jgi:DEAD/DEAH box helicase domain-containing protein
MDITDIEVLEEIKRKKINGFTVSSGEVEVTEKYIKYKIMKYGRVLSTENLNLPPLSFKTMALWLTIPENIRKKVEDRRLDFAGGLHGLEHALIAVMPFHVMCDRWDIGGVSVPSYPPADGSKVFLYDGFEGGIGLTEKAFQLTDNIFKMSYELVRDCQCEEGCPACIYSPKCGNGNRPLDKEATKMILRELI